MNKVIDKFSGDYAFLSNFAECKVFYNGLKFPSVEHAFQAAKSIDIKEQEIFAKLELPGDAKRLGRQIHLRKDWEIVKVRVMEDLLRQKFNQAPFKELLLRTKDYELIEGNTWNDRFWGVCNGAGRNMLGELLMKIRNELELWEGLND
jgi:ribA/ribD-fused uncharacterized protein